MLPLAEMKMRTCLEAKKWISLFSLAVKSEIPSQQGSGDVTQAAAHVSPELGGAAGNSPNIFCDIRYVTPESGTLR